MMDRVDVAIIGAGPCGLGAAWRIERLRSVNDHIHCSYALFDAGETAGGHAQSVVTPEGFIFDHGGHVLFPHAHYSDFLSLLEELIPEWYSSVPMRGVWMAGQIIPYPIQRNIHRLPLRDLIPCLWGLMQAKKGEAASANNSGLEEQNLRDYFNQRFGTELTDRVLAPLNQKMWAYPPEMLGSRWTAQRSGSKLANVPDVQIQKILKNFLIRKDDPGWTANTFVRYPLAGGTGAIWSELASRLSGESQRMKSNVVAVDAHAKRLVLGSGEVVSYKWLLSSIPLDNLLHLISGVPSLTKEADAFVCASSTFAGFGVAGPVPERLRGIHSFHVPLPDISFWRVTFPSNISPGNVPEAGQAWSVLCECSQPFSDAGEQRYSAEVIESELRKLSIIPPQSKIVSKWSAFLPHGYPVPFLERDRVVDRVQSHLRALSILSRGRFGGWKYEVSNQDHAFMQGVEAVDHILLARNEETYFFGNRVN